MKYLGVRPSLGTQLLQITCTHMQSCMLAYMVIQRIKKPTCSALHSIKAEALQRGFHYSFNSNKKLMLLCRAFFNLKIGTSLVQRALTLTLVILFCRHSRVALLFPPPHQLQSHFKHLLLLQITLGVLLLVDQKQSQPQPQQKKHRLLQQQPADHLQQLHMLHPLPQTVKQ